ncbi:sodium:alanine symporter [Pseudoalteromonas luteoviolacea]|uniref:Sodium:alanine symporter n=1 Tax=Pseudoalteromonas luteoviolacea TaxID=43657 RepID=A0A1C0TPP9_9GAMM|nr:alanine/glycine:cation symporter family protein [Pseudoalteromonas luteoviolacea]MBQ4811848.1 alanine:cation symporter family protein [Pseudoalteromonas luteoviolacea]OCQ20886.1 sodium:alanine symporter [Pseudoalteromonas luteoviolacea]
MSEYIVGPMNNLLWGNGQLLIYVLLFAGVWFSVKLRFIQLRDFTHMFKLLKQDGQSDPKGISSFQALCTGLSARVGTGNLAGVAMAISLGGSGAVFWMWVIALLGMATGFAESVLGQLYKVRDSHQEFRGGPAYYIRSGLNNKWLAVLFSLCLFLGYGASFSAMQANTIAEALNNTFSIPTHISGLVIAAVAGVIVLGGFKRIARFAELVVPWMGLAFIATAVIIAAMHITEIPALIFDIVMSAFGLTEASAGALGAAIKSGIQRGMYSNEAGAGSVPHAAAGAAPKPNHPVAQGYIQMLGVFLDTIVLCSCTALVVLLAGVGSTGEIAGIGVTQYAMSQHFGEYGDDFIAAAITLFAFTSVVANYAYAESNLHFFRLDNKWGKGGYTLIYLCMVVWGANASLKEAWNLADMSLGLMTLVNIYAIVQLTPTIVNLLRDYTAKKRAGGAMEFRCNEVKIQGQVADNVWKN